jgi:hypothetical protein
MALLSVLTPLLLALPVVERPGPAPEPVPPDLRRVVLDAVDRAAAAAPAPGLPAAAVTDETDGRRTLALTGERAAPAFSMVGVTWASDPAAGAVEAWVRTRTDGRWTDWSPLGGRADEDPDAGTAEATSGRDGTSPLWVGESDGVQARVDVVTGAAPRDLRLELVDPGESEADATAATSTPPASSASAEAGRPSIRSRAQWGADESIRRGSPSYASTLRAATIHHTASSNDYTREQVPGILRGFYAYHVKSLGWSDIGYNVLVDKFGTAWEGRYGGLHRPVIGAHAGGFNTGTVGVSMIGTHSTVAPTSATRSTVAAVVGWKLGLHWRDPRDTVRMTSGGSTRYKAGTTVTLPAVFGHREVSTTDCPGGSGMAALPGLRSAAAAAIGAGLVNPSSTEDASGVRLRAGVVSPMSYELTVTSLATGSVVRRLTGSADGPFEAVWDRRGVGGGTLPGGRYKLTLSGSTGASLARPWSTNVTIDGPSAESAWGPLDAAALTAAETDLVTRAPGGAVTYRRVESAALGDGTSLGGKAVGAPAAAWRGASVLNVFVRGGDDGLWVNGRLPGGDWAGWSSMGGTLTARPEVAGTTGSLNVLVRGSKGSVQHRWSNVTGSWSGWEDLGGGLLPGTGPSATWTSAGRLEVVVVGTDRQLWRKAWTPATGWTGWEGIGGRTDEEVTITSPSGDEVLVAARDADGSVHVRGVTASGAGSWQSLGGLALGTPALSAAPGSGKPALFVVGGDGALWQRVRSAGTWSHWSRLG